MTKYRKELFLLLLLCGAAFGESAIVTVVKGVAIVSQDKDKPWRKYDEVCVWQEGSEIGCGIVMKLTGARAVLKLFHPVKQEPKVGDVVLAREEEREAAAKPSPVPSPIATPTPTPAVKELPAQTPAPKKFLPFR